METKRVRLDQKNQEGALQEAALLLLQGEVVAFPTETVYGLGANALDPVACAKIFKIKGRPADNPLIVHVAAVSEAREIVRHWPEEAEKCAAKFWPGPLTLVLPKKDIIPDIVSGDLDTVAIRMPSHPVALDLIKAASRPLAAPSANISGKPSPTDGEHVWQDLKGKVPLILDAGRTAYGLESTVLDLTASIPVILRPGGISREQLTGVLGNVELEQVALGQSFDGTGTAAPKSPGMKYRHYAPEGKVVLINEGSWEQTVHTIKTFLENKKSQKLAILCMQETADALKQEDLSEIDLIYVLGSRQKPEEAASRLFGGLRLCDREGIDIILVEGMPEQGIGLAYMNRVSKAAGKNIYPEFGKI